MSDTDEAQAWSAYCGTSQPASKQTQEEGHEVPEIEAEDAYERQRITMVEKQRAERETRRAEEDANRHWRTQRYFQSVFGGGTGRIIDWRGM